MFIDFRDRQEGTERERERERQRDRETERQRDRSVAPVHTLTGNQTCNLLVHRTMFQHTEPPGQREGNTVFKLHTTGPG